MNKTKLKKNFLITLEIFYQNYGNVWSVKNFSKNSNVQAVLRDYLLLLEEKGVVKLLDSDKFKIIDLPSNKNI